MAKTGSDPDRSWLAGLIYECPFGTALPDCPLAEIRKLPLAERFKIVRKMPKAKIDAIVAHHLRCLAEREAASPARPTPAD